MDVSHHWPTPEELERRARERLEALLSPGRPLTPKERLAIPPQRMPEQPPEVRIHNMREVTYGYGEAQARLEAMRCLQCKNAPCVGGCPVRIRIPEFIRAVAEGRFRDAVTIIKRDSLLPAVCGRVCPQETQCQAPCTVGRALKDPEKAVSIGRLERFVADWERRQGAIEPPAVESETGRRVAVVGSGPAGLVCAADLRRHGHGVTVFEAFHKFGGVMVYGIPEFRLPKEVVRVEVDTLRKMGVQLAPNFAVGKTRRLRDLMDKDGFDAVFLGVGAGLPRFLGVPGENLVGVFSANEYLTRANLMRAFERGKALTPIYISRRTAVIGGGNVAMDAARTALRLGSDEVHVIYRRTEVEMPARVEEVHHAHEEGVQFHFLRNPMRFIGDENGRVRAMELLKYRLGEPDESGRRRPVPIPGSEYIMEVDGVVVAIGNKPNPLIPSTTPGLKTTRWGTIEVDEKGQTSIPRVFAGGDIVLGAATVILAMGQGRTAAASIHRLLSGGGN